MNLAGCHEVVRQARRAPGCLDFAISADVINPSRINVFERWESAAAVETFRGSSPSDGPNAAIVSATIGEYGVDAARSIG